MNTEESLKEYLQLQLKIPLLARIGPLARTFDFVANAAPGVKEILTVGKLCWEVRERPLRPRRGRRRRPPATSSGQLAAPQSINELVQVGMVRNQTDWMLDILNDPRQTGVVIVSAPEEMPVNETHRAGRAARRPRPTSTSPRSSSTGCCPSCSAAARRRSSTRSREPARVEALVRAGRRRRRRRCSTAAELAVTPAPHPGRATSPACASDLPAGPAAALRARTCSPGATASGPPSQVAEHLGRGARY